MPSLHNMVSFDFQKKTLSRIGTYKKTAPIHGMEAGCFWLKVSYIRGQRESQMSKSLILSQLVPVKTEIVCIFSCYAHFPVYGRGFAETVPPKAFLAPISFATSLLAGRCVIADRINKYQRRWAVCIFKD